MAETADLEYLRRRRAQKQSNIRSGPQVLQNGSDVIEPSAQDASWTTLAQSNNQQPKDTGGRNDNPWTRTVDTVQNLGLNVLGGFFQGIRGLVNAGAYVVGLFGDDNFKAGVQDFMSYDWTAPVKMIYRQLDPSIVFSGNIGSEEFRRNWVQNWSDLGDIEKTQAALDRASRNSYASDWGQTGEIIQSIESGVGSVVGNLAANAILPGSGLSHSAATLGVMGTSAFGSGAEEAMQDGASYGQAGASGLISGAIETGTELASAGIGKALGIGSHIAGQSVGKQASKSIVKELVHNALEEGTEEFVSEILSPLSKVPYKGTESFGEYSSPELYKNALVAFLGGAAGGVFSGGIQSYAMRKTYGPKIVELSNLQEEISDLHERATKEARKGNKADQKLISEYDERGLKIAEKFKAVLDEMQADTSKDGKRYYRNFLKALKDPNGAMTRLAQSGNTEAEEYLSNHEDVVKAFGESTYNRLAKTMSNDSIKYIVGGNQFEEGSTNKAFIKSGNTVYINPAYQQEFFSLVGHEVIGHAWLDLVPSQRDSFVAEIESNKQLSEEFHKNDAKIEKAYSKGEFESERVANFIERMILNADQLESVRWFRDNASLRGKLRSMLNAIKTRINAMLGNKSAKTIEQINKALKAIERENSAMESSEKSSAYSKDLNTETDSEGNQLSKAQQEFFKNSKIRDDDGNLEVMYHGTERGDRVGYYFNPERASSGPMAFFTNNQEIAENYSNDKRDTSIETPESYQGWYTTKDGKPLYTLWNKLSQKEKIELRDKALQIRFDDEADEIILVPENRNGLGDLSWKLRSESNVIKALVDEWLSDGNLYGSEERFMEVLKLLGIADKATYIYGEGDNRKVYEVFLNVTNPFIVSEMSEKDIKGIRDTVKKQPDKEDTLFESGAYFWDKKRISPKTWLEMFERDLKDGASHSWTIIPDYITEYLKSQGYDGIQDTGGKGGGSIHKVVIPFYSNQIKSVENKNPTSDPDIRYAKDLSEEHIDELRSEEISKQLKGRSIQELSNDVLADLDAKFADSHGIKLTTHLDMDNNDYEPEIQRAKNGKPLTRYDSSLVNYDGDYEITSTVLSGIVWDKSDIANYDDPESQAYFDYKAMQDRLSPVLVEKFEDMTRALDEATEPLSTDDFARAYSAYRFVQSDPWETFVSSAEDAYNEKFGNMDDWFDELTPAVDTFVSSFDSYVDRVLDGEFLTPEQLNEERRIEAEKENLIDQISKVKRYENIRQWKLFEKLTRQDIDAIARISKGEVLSNEEFMALPLIQDAERYNVDHKQLDALENPELVNEVMDEFRKEYFTKDYSKGRKVLMVTGLPSAGKSTNQLRVFMKENRALEFDNDIMKQAKAIKTYYDGGRGANTVQDIASEAQDRLFVDLLNEGYNFVFPAVGKKTNKIIAQLSQFQKAGYTIEFMHIKVPNEMAQGRALIRYASTGRYVSLKYINSIGDGTEKAYNEIEDLRKNGKLEFENQTINIARSVEYDNSGDSPEVIRDSRSEEVSASSGALDQGSGAQSELSGSKGLPATPGLGRQYIDADDAESIKPSQDSNTLDIPTEYVKALAEISNEQVFAHQAVEDIVKSCAIDIASIVGVPTDAESMANTRVLFNGESRTKAIDSIFRTMNEKGVSVDNLSDEIAKSFEGIQIKIGSDLIDVNQMMEDSETLKEAIKNSVSDHISALLNSAQDSVVTRAEKREQAMKEGYKARLESQKEAAKSREQFLTAVFEDIKDKLKSYGKEMRDRIAPNRTMRALRDSAKRSLVAPTSITKDNDTLRMGSIIVEPLLNLEAKNNGYSSKLKDGTWLRDALDNVLKTYTSDINESRTNDSGESIPASLFPYDATIADQIELLRDSLAAPIEKTRHFKDGHTDTILIYPTLTAEQTRLANSIVNNVKSVYRKAVENATKNYLPLGMGAIEAVELSSDSKFATKATSNAYLREFASSYVIVNSMFGGSKIATEMTVGMDQATSNKDKFVDGIRQTLKKRIEPIKNLLNKKVVIEVSGNRIETKRGVLIDAYATLHTANLDDMERNGTVLYDDKGREITVFEGKTSGATNLLNVLEKELSSEEKSFANWLIKDFYNGKEIQEHYTATQRARGLVDVELLEGYYPRNAAMERLSNVEQAIKAPRSFGHEKKRVKHSHKFVFADAVARAVSFADDLGTQEYVRPQYIKVINSLNAKTDSGETAWHAMESKFPEQARNIKAMLGMYMGVDPRGQKAKSRAMSILMGGYTRSLLALNPGTPFRQTISALYSVFGMKRTGKAIIDRFAMSKEMRAEYNGFCKEFAEIALRAKDNSPLIPAGNGAGTIWEAVQKLSDLGMKPIQFMDSQTIKVLLVGAMTLAKDCGYSVGTTEYRQAVRDFLGEALLTQIGHKPSNMSAASSGYGKSGLLGEILTFMGGPARAAVAAQSDKIKTASVVASRGITEKTVEENYNQALKDVEKAEKAFDLAEEALQAAKESKIEDDIEKAQKKFDEASDNFIEARAYYEQALADKHTWAKYIAMGGRKWPVDAIILMLIGSLFNALINEFSKRVRGKKDWDDAIDGKEYLVDAGLYFGFGWLPAANSITNAVKGYDTSYPAGAMLTDMGNLVSSVVNLMSNQSEKNVKKLVRELVTAFSVASGLPLKNAYSLIYGAVNAVSKDAADRLQSAFYTSYATASTDIVDAVDARDYKEASRLIGKQFSERIGQISEPLKQEIMGLYKDGVSVAPTSIGDTFTNTAGSEVKLTWTQQQSIRNAYSKANVAATKVLSKSYYARLDADDRGYIVQSLYNAYRQGAYRSVLGGSYKTNAIGVFASSGANSVGDILSAVFYVRKLEATSSKTKKQLAVEFVNRLALSKNDKLLVLHLAGYKVDENAVRKSLASRGLSRKEINEIVNP